MDDFTNLDVEDVVFELSDRLDVLIELLIEKKIFSQDEYNKKIETLQNKN